MSSRTKTFLQLFARLAIGITFLSAVADRFGIWGPPGTSGFQDTACRAAAGSFLPGTFTSFEYSVDQLILKNNQPTS